MALLRQNGRKKPNIGSVKIEAFSDGKGEKYRRWRKAVEAAQILYELEDGELALLIYLAVKGAARECLELLTIPEI